jgi:hypothetical protein
MNTLITPPLSLPIQILQDNRTLIIRETIKWQTTNYLISTSRSFDKCSRDLFFVFDAYINDLISDSTRNITYVASRYWFNNERQIKEYETEIAVHDYMIDYILKNIVADQDDLYKDKLINLKSILTETIISGPKYMNYGHMHKYKYVMNYDTEKLPDPFIIKQSLYEAWSTTPSKQQFMPYNIFVLGPDDKKIKELIYYKALVNEYKTNYPRYDVDELDLVALEEIIIKQRDIPLYANLKTAPYVLICTQRVEDQLNPYVKNRTSQGFNFEQTDSAWQTDPKRKNRGSVLAMLEIGMFVQSFANLCLKHNIDISHTRCLPTTMEFWSEPEFSFLKNPPQLVMSAGFGKNYRRELYQAITHAIDYRPDFERIVKFVK